MIKQKSSNWIQNLTKTPTLEENSDYEKFMREHVKVKLIKIFHNFKKILKLFFLHFQDKDNGEKFIELKELRDALKTVGINIPGCDLRLLEDEFKKNDVNHDGKLSIEEFSKV